MDHQHTAPKSEKLGEIGLHSFPPYLMNRIMGRYNTSVREELAKLDLGTPEARVLAVLSVNDGLLIRDLAVYTVTEQSTLSRALDRLQTRCQIRREADRDDKRGVRVLITDAGRAAFEALWPNMAAASAQMFRGITEDERQSFVGTLQKMLANIRRHDL